MKLKLMGVALATTVALVGCGTTNNDDGTATKDGVNDGNKTNVEQTRYNDRADNNRHNDRINNDRGTANNDNNRMNNRDGAKNNERYDVSKEAADKITDQVDDVDRAYVLTTKNNAYVGVAMDGDRDNRTDRKNDNANVNDNNNNTNDNDNRKNHDRDNMTNHDGINNTGDLNHTDGTRNKGDDHDVTDDVKKQVTDAVKSVDNDIDNVYVTTNPDFIDLTSDYADEARNGHPIGGFFNQIGDMIQRVFPTGNR